MSDRTKSMREPAGDLRFDRLVDGALTDEEYRSLLAQLDQEPGAWRQCAMAFLEAEALAREFGGIRRAAERCTQAAPPVVQPKYREIGSAIGMLLAVAVSFLVAFGLGIAAPKLFDFSKQEGLAAGNNSPSASNGNDTNNVGPDVRYVGDVRLLVDSTADGTQEAGRVPVYEVGQDVGRYLTSERPVLGPELLELLRQYGYDVRHEQQYFPAPLEDGRQIIVPVDGYQITPVSRRY